ncbi:BTAD domain-containing putative transcriptional regulator [Ferrovibrio sp.]|uniref:BTAD domain-containing putative transcriptional regulator n=1 Tax=Ferrovibrio sp. TaxID=1917215 RepID=UPI003D2C4F3D
MTYSARITSPPRLERALHLCLLGPFQATLEGQSITDGLGRKAQALLAYLAAQPGHAATREELAALLWGERFDDQARQSLRQTLLTIRRQLGPNADAILQAGRLRIALQPAHFSTDLADLEAALTADDSHALRNAVALLRGDLVAGLDVASSAWEEWLRAHRVVWREKALALLGRSLRASMAAGAATDALIAAQKLQQLDPFDEAAHCLALEAIARFKGLAAAQQAHRDFAAMLDAELGVRPSPETLAFLAQLEAAPLTPQPAQIAGIATTRVAKPTGWRLPYGLAAACAALALVAGLLRPAAAPPADVARFAFALAPLAVLDRSDFTARQAQAFADDLATALAGLPAAAIDRRRGTRIQGSLRQERDGYSLNLRAEAAKDGRIIWVESRRVESITPALARDMALGVFVAQLNAASQDLPPPGKPDAAVQAEIKAGWDALRGGSNKAKAEESIRRFAAARALDPASTDALTGYAHGIAMKVISGWSEQRDADHAEALRLLDAAILRDPRNETAHFTVALLHKGRRDYHRGLLAMRVVLALNPGHPAAHAQTAHMSILTGNPVAGAEHAELAIRLGPRANAIDRAYLYAGMAQLLLGNFALSEERLAQSLRINPEFPDAFAWRAAALAQLGRLQEARALHGELLRRWPDWRVDHHLLQSQDRAAMARFTDALARVTAPGG